MSLVFFHQNAVSGVQGGIERYLATLLDEGGERCAMVSEAAGDVSDPRRYGLRLPLSAGVPQWLRFVVAVWKSAPGIRRFLAARQATVLEFSRPEYVLFAFLFCGRKIFTIHGTGPAPQERGKYLLHHATCLLLPFFADGIQVVGRDPSGLPGIIRGIMRGKIIYIDAWFDDCFRPSPFPATNGPIRVFYAGRLAKMKNPELLFAVARRMKERLGAGVDFAYFGSSGGEIPADLRGTHIRDCGLLSAQQLAHEIAGYHMGILCSAFGEGSPFIVVETLACGRGYVLPPLPGLKETYRNNPGIRFAEDYASESFERHIEALFADISSTALTPELIAGAVDARSRPNMATAIIDRLLHG